jgi:superfamily I DNA/RNA helicase
LHRAKALVKRYAPQRVFLTTYTTSLAQELQRRARLLISANDLATLRIQNLDKYVQEEIQRFCPGTQIIYKEQQLQTITRFDELCTQRGIFGPHRMLVWDEWQQVIDAWNIRSESEYLEFERVGRRYALQSGQRRTYWAIFEQMRQYLRNAYCMTPAMACYELAQRLRSRPPFRCVIADEAQDFGPAQMCLLQSLAPPDQPDNLFLCVDVAQRIYTRSVPWIRYGIDVRGRSHRLRINYRNTREIQETAERVLTPEMQIQQAQALDDPDALQERIASGWRPVPVLCNPDVPPVLRPCRSRVEEAEQLLQWIRECHANNIQYDEIAVVARTKDVLNEIIAEVLRELGITACECGQVATPEQIYADTAHAVKGLEFRAVAIVAADLFPLVVRERHIAEDYEQRERNLLFTAMTRPRERLYISWSGKLPEFLGQVTL